MFLIVNKIFDAVSRQLGTTFGSDYRYYVENVEQNLTTPCFTIDMLLPLQRSKSPLLYDRTMPLVIHYFSDDKTYEKKDCYAKAEQVIECLEYLPFNDTLIRGEDISWQLVDNVLQVFITYKFATAREVPIKDNMEDYSGLVSHSN